MKSLSESFLQSVKRFPDRPALWVDNRFYTYTRLCDMALKLAAALYAFPKPRCAILSSRNITAYTAVLAILLADKTYVPLSITSPLSVNINLLSAIDTDLIIIDSNQADYAHMLLERYGKPLQIIAFDPNANQIDTDFSNTDNHCHDYPCPTFKNKNAYLLFTSGSTGVPKGVMVSHANALAYIHAMTMRSQPCSTDRFSQLAEFTFDFSVHDLFVAWSVGACVYSISNKHLIHWRQFMNQHRLTFWASVPSAIHFLQRTDQIDTDSMKSLRYSVFCGESLSHSLAATWKRSAPNSIIDNLYGPTEAAVACTGFIWQPDAVDEGVPIGFPFPRQHIMIVNEHNQRVQSGELCLSGPQVVSGYWRNDRLTRERFFTLPNDNRLWYRTNDIVTWNENVGLIYQGRLDDQLKIRGRCVTKLEIEFALQAIAKTSAIAVTPKLIEGTQLVEHIIAFVSHPKLSTDQILKQARKTLPEYMVPFSVIELPSLPLNKNGKIDYLALARLL